MIVQLSLYLFKLMFSLDDQILQQIFFLSMKKSKIQKKHQKMLIFLTLSVKNEFVTKFRILYPKQIFLQTAVIIIFQYFLSVKQLQLDFTIYLNLLLTSFNYFAIYLKLVSSSCIQFLTTRSTKNWSSSCDQLYVVLRFV